MRVLVVCEDFAAYRDEPDGAARLLEELGCRVIGSSWHDEDLPEDDPDLIVVVAGNHLGQAGQALGRLRGQPGCDETPAHLVVGMPRLTALNFATGFDDFILEPLLPAELHARLRQLDWKSASFDGDEMIKVGDLVIDVAGYEAHVAGRRLTLTRMEFELLRFLAENRGRAFTREHLVRKVWDMDYGGGNRTVDIHVRRLRAKLGGHGRLLATVRNVGYKMID